MCSSDLPLYPLENSKLNGYAISTFRFNLQIKVYCVFVNLCINAIDQNRYNTPNVFSEELYVKTYLLRHDAFLHSRAFDCTAGHGAAFCTKLCFADRQFYGCRTRRYKNGRRKYRRDDYLCLYHPRKYPLLFRRYFYASKIGRASCRERV